MTGWVYRWQDGSTEHEFRMVHVPGATTGDFHLAVTPVTQAFWSHVTGDPLLEGDEWRDAPQTDISWNDLRRSGGFLDRLNRSGILAAERDGRPFRLPTEAEWEWAARGGPHAPDGFRFSGSDDPDEVAWYGRRWTRTHQAVVTLLGWRIGWRLVGRGLRPIHTRAQPVARKRPNQLGLYDMSGNVWEWCEDACGETGPERRLRGGCHHNWDLHCTVDWRYGIEPDAKDGCIGVRLACG